MMYHEMVKKKFILWALALLVLAGTVTSIVMYRLHRHEQKEAAALARKNSKSSKDSNKAKRMPEEDAPEKPEPPPPKPPKATVLGPATKEHLAEKTFISALRTAIQWRGTQPQTPEAHQALLQKLSAIPVDDLPPERRAAWHSLLETWQILAQPSHPTDPNLQEQGRKASETLNLMLKAHGDHDLAF